MSIAILDTPSIHVNVQDRLLRISRDLLDCVPFSCKHFCFALDKSKVVVVGWNHGRSHPLASRFGFYEAKKEGVHAEIDVITRLPYGSDCTKLTLVNIRLNRFGEVRLSKPCRRCQTAIGKYGFKRVIFTNQAGGFECLL